MGKDVATSKRAKVAYAIKLNCVEVRLDLAIGDDDFEDVTFLVSNCNDERKAVRRVREYVNAVHCKLATT